MNLLALIALLVTLVAAVFTFLMGFNMLSGPFEGRTCLTECVQLYYYIAMGAAILGLILSFLSFRKAEGRIMSVLAFLGSAGICGLFAVLFIAGNFF